MDSDIRDLLTSGARAMYFKDPKAKGPVHPALRLEEGLGKLYDCIEQLEKRIKTLEDG